jgi:hypothetical protein
MWAETELNRRHKDFQSFALPTELSARKNESKLIEFVKKIQMFFWAENIFSPSVKLNGS